MHEPREAVPQARRWLADLVLSDECLSLEQVDTLQAIAAGMMWSLEMDCLIRGLATGIEAYHRRTFPSGEGTHEEGASHDDSEPAGRD